MKLSESQLRRIIRQQLRVIEEQAVATGARGRTPLSDQQKREIANRFRDSLEAALIDRGLVRAGENWSLMVNLGRSGWSIGKRAGVLSTSDRGDVRRAVASIVPQFSGDRENLIRGRRLKLALSDTGAPPAREEEDPAPQSPRTGRTGGGGGRDRPCVQMRQQDLNAAFADMERETPTLRGAPVFPLDTDGVVGPMTQAAFYIVMERELTGDICDEANGIPDPETEEGPQSGRTGDGGQPDQPSSDEPSPEPQDDDGGGPTLGPPEEDPCVEIFENYIDIACEEISDNLKDALERMQNPLMRPSFYEDISSDTALYTQFSGFGLTDLSADMKDRFQSTLVKFKELLTCSCRLGPGTHAALAEELIEHISQSSYLFGRLSSGMPQIMARMVASKGAAAGKWLASTSLARHIPGVKDLAGINILDDEQEGWEGYDEILGFDSPDPQALLAIRRAAEALDRVSCPPEGEDPILPEKYQTRYIRDCDRIAERGIDDQGEGPIAGPEEASQQGYVTNSVALRPPCSKVVDGNLVADLSGTAPDGTPCDNYFTGDAQDPGNPTERYTDIMQDWMKRQLELAGLPYPDEQGAFDGESAEEASDDETAGELIDQGIDYVKGLWGDITGE